MQDTGQWELAWGGSIIAELVVVIRHFTQVCTGTQLKPHGFDIFLF